jgi:hypothetical protein
MNVKFVLAPVVGMFLLVTTPFARAEVSGGTANFKPDTFLAQYPRGEAGLASEVRNLLLSDRATLPLIIGLLSGANGSQQKAIADGLAQAAKDYLKTDAACALNAPVSPVCFATQIQQAVANSGDPNFIKAYASIAGDTGTASTGGGGGGGGGGGQTGNSAPSGGQNTGSIPSGSTPTPTKFTNFFTGSAVGSANSSSVSATSP